MSIPYIKINDTEYPLDTTLRVAYKVQGMNDHRPYSKVFAELGDMLLEKQIEILYVAFQIANPEAARSITQSQFLDYYLGHYTLKEVMNQLQEVIKGVLGEDAFEETEASTNQGN